MIRRALVAFFGPEPDRGCELGGECPGSPGPRESRRPARGAADRRGGPRAGQPSLLPGDLAGRADPGRRLHRWVGLLAQRADGGEANGR